MNKLGFYIEVSTRQWIPEALVEAKPPTILWHAGDRGKLQEIRHWRSPDSFIIGRMFLENQEQDAMLKSADPAAAGRSLADRILGYDMGYAIERVNGRLLIDAWMSLNEPIPGPASSDFQSKPAEVKQKLQAYDAFQIGFRERLQTQNLEAVAFNFAAGNFTQASHYLDWCPRTLEAYKYLGFHEYGWPALKPGPDVASGALLYRPCMEGIRQKYGNRHEIIITECGLARMYKYPVDPPGDVGWLYTGETIAQDRYWESLAWYNAELCRDSYVKGACLYQVGHGGGKWETFRHLGEDNQSQSIQIISRIAKLRDTPAPPAQPPSQPVQPTPPSPPTLPPPAEPAPLDLAGLKQRAAALETKLTPAVQQLAALSQLASQKARLDAAAAQVTQASNLLPALAALQTRIKQAQAQAAQRSDITAALRQRVADLQTALTALQGRMQTVAGLAPAIMQAQKDLQTAIAALGNLAPLQKQAANLQTAVKSLRADLDKPLTSGDEISLQNPAPGVRISQTFGQNPAVYKPLGFAGHEGIDYACAIGTSILAAADGVVYRSGATAGNFGPNKDQGAYGIRVIVEHTWGDQKGYTIYAHLSSVSVNVDDRVNAGAVVGKSGNTGNSSGAHLHFSLVLVDKKNPGYPASANLAANAWYHDPAPFMVGGRGVDDWMEDWFDGDMDDGEEIVCLPPGEFDEI
jgi:murein DD-endopeptidase MepM/ murein hydrolase activator NlpD